ncbi:MAG: class I SAM-dependent methyltransferase [Steroidobacteraceae bacterium]
MRMKTAYRFSRLAAAACLCAGAAVFTATAADLYDAAVAHGGRSAADQKRDALDHPAEILRLSGIRPGMRVADVLAGDGYYSELLSYVVGPSGRVLSINNAAFDAFSERDRQQRLAAHRLPNVRHETVDLNNMNLAPHSLDAVLLIKVYHDLYWVETDGKFKWPKIDPNRVLSQLREALKPGGVLMVVDHSAAAGSGSTQASTLHRIEEAFAVKDFESHGFKRVASSEILRRPEDARDQITYEGPMLGKTDRFIAVFRKAT